MSGSWRFRNRAFQGRAGVHEYILERRLDGVAREMTTPGDARTISELAELYGFSTLETFWRAFKRRHGLTLERPKQAAFFVGDFGLYSIDAVDV